MKLADQQKRAESEQDEDALKRLRKQKPKTAQFKPINDFGYDQGQRNEPGEKRIRRGR